MDTRRQELRTILGPTIAAAIDLHERQGRAALDPLQRAEHLRPLVEWAADTIEAWACAGPRAATPYPDGHHTREKPP
jgi:hypothetical protein